MVVDGPAHLVLDHIQGLPLGSDLLAGDGHAADALGGTLDEAVKVGLTGGADDHDVVRAVVSHHAHTADVVLKPAGGDLRGDGGQGLGINVLKVVGGHQAHALPGHGLGDIPIGKGAGLQLGSGLAPLPAPAAGTVFVQILEDLLHVDPLVHIQLVLSHQFAPPSNSAAALSQSLPSLRATPASRMEIFSLLERR